VSEARYLRRWLISLLRDHEKNGELPTSGRFLFYELVQRGAVSKEGEGRQRPDQPVSKALTWLREQGHIPWEWIVDETRSLDRFLGASSVRGWLLDVLSQARLDPWAGDAPLILTESRSLAGVLRVLVSEYATQIAATNGQCGGFLHTEIVPVLSPGQRVLYLGDLDLSGGQIEENTRRVLESKVGELDWERLALTKNQVDQYDLPVIEKFDNRYKPARLHEAVETEALSQSIIVKIVRDRLDKLLPMPLAKVVKREARERAAILKIIQGKRP
jgi:hypothetical protein